MSQSLPLYGFRKPHSFRRLNYFDKKKRSLLEPLLAIDRLYKQPSFLLVVIFTFKVTIKSYITLETDSINVLQVLPSGTSII